MVPSHFTLLLNVDSNSDHVILNMHSFDTTATLTALFLQQDCLRFNRHKFQNKIYHYLDKCERNRKNKQISSLYYWCPEINQCWIHGIIHENNVPVAPLSKQMAVSDLSFQLQLRILAHSLHIPVYQNMLPTFRINSHIQICQFVLDWPCSWISPSVELHLVSNSPIDIHVSGRLAYLF